jgi:hypothetical protein
MKMAARCKPMPHDPFSSPSSVDLFIGRFSQDLNLLGVRIKSNPATNS